MSLRHIASAGLIIAAALILARFATQATPPALTGGVVVRPETASVADILTIPAATFTSHRAVIADASPDLFAYAHGTVMAHDKIFLGMAAVHGNPYPTNQIVVFDQLPKLDHTVRLTIPGQGDIQTMAYDEKADKIYFIFSKDHRLDLYWLDPGTYSFASILSTSSVDVGAKPAIVTDGAYVYGITNTDPSTVFKVRISDGALSVSAHGHISGGHSAAIGTNVNGTSTELYFGGGMSGMFEKDEASTLRPLGTKRMQGCVLTNDMPYDPIDARGGYVYIGCETTPEGYRIRTVDLDAARFPLPGESFGLFIFGNDLYNASYDGHVDVFPDKDIGDLHRYYLANGMKYSDAPGNELNLNQMFYQPKTRSLYVTAWWGVRDLFRVELGK